ncbi:hypothetical protein EMIT0232MI5_150012 [Pseudomonas sp. IT-232MI5]
MNANFERPTIGSLSLGRGLGGRRSDEGQEHHKTKAEHRFSPLNRPSVSSPAFDLDPRATSEG